MIAFPYFVGDGWFQIRQGLFLMPQNSLKGNTVFLLTKYGCKIRGIRWKA
jgi:hypothetical protein